MPHHLSPVAALFARADLHYGSDTAILFSGFALRLLLYGLMGSFAAAFMKRFGLRPVASVALGVIGAGGLGSSFMTEFWSYGLCGLSLPYPPFTDSGLASPSLFPMSYALDWGRFLAVNLTDDRFGELANLVFG
ncbi:MFS transporter [Pararhodospirillum photometricum]|uniref:Major facilitator superfamily MFS_1 n=1 Tax=Pararhodospirillum photometricum DSM 122 TaxID=1150469 RepID=H6SQU7_PARPM|nr:MFS transporter [Pararhodospirillum photometricum]CCG07412.1 Major facilitator superfamily MFS_1 [Pararhodospirillum photometricum DSM 122]